MSQWGRCWLLNYIVFYGAHIYMSSLCGLLGCVFVISLLLLLFFSFSKDSFGNIPRSSAGGEPPSFSIPLSLSLISRPLFKSTIVPTRGGYHHGSCRLHQANKRPNSAVGWCVCATHVKSYSCPSYPHYFLACDDLCFETCCCAAGSHAPDAAAAGEGRQQWPDLLRGGGGAAVPARQLL